MACALFGSRAYPPAIYPPHIYRFGFLWTPVYRYRTQFSRSFFLLLEVVLWFTVYRKEHIRAKPCALFIR